MKNTTQMLDAIYKVFIRDLEGMSIDELRAELAFYIEQDIINMGSDEARSTYQYLTDMGEL